MLSLNRGAIASLLTLKVVLICALLIYLQVLPSPITFIVGNNASHNSVGCTKEARVCPDGSYVSRVGPSCEFQVCAEKTLPSGTEEVLEPPSVDQTPTTTYSEPNDGAVACTMDAKQCPDGSYVGRSGPSCAFEPCPTQTRSSNVVSVAGTVMVGPTCPVERNPPEPQCAPRPYEGAIVLTNTGNGASYTATTNAEGTFTLTLERGVYSVSRPESSSPFPACSGKVEILSAGAPIPIFCDSGIR
jgi:hypothetical protein